MHCNCDLALRNIPLSKQPFKTQPQSENENLPWGHEYNLPDRRSNKCRALSLQEVELESWFLILHIVLETCTLLFMHKFNTSFVLHSYFLGLTSWIWTNPSIEVLKFENPFKWNSYEGFNLDQCPPPMIGENRQLVTNESVEVRDRREITNHFRVIYRIYLNLIKENRRMCNM